MNNKLQTGTGYWYLILTSCLEFENINLEFKKSC
jgi:hypothetical protein